ncbi:unnamed protein product [Thelazia callipaeda]|uniref:Protein kinase domain-containing protein n=1 Tax=Thelazia callipaeda TaxID=103827 RepID=A0A0N5DAQ7_THECL|nr:unnamed protein product [Thelazia callipaeda]
MQSARYCEEQCEKSIEDDLCDNKIKDKEFCWRTCGGILNEGPKPEIPNHIRWTYTPSYAINITWDGNGVIYLLEVSKESETVEEYVEDILLVNTSLVNYTKSEMNFCDTLFFRLATVTSGGVSNFSEIQEIAASAPEIVQNLTVQSMEFIVSIKKAIRQLKNYLRIICFIDSKSKNLLRQLSIFQNQPFSDNGYYSNGTIQLTLRYAIPKYNWPLGERDVKVDLLFHMVSCDVPDLSKAVPAPEFLPGMESQTLVAKFGADLMYRKCQFLYYVSSVHSAHCGTTETNSDFDENSMKPLRIDCSTVENSPCAYHTKLRSPPMCGQVEGFNYQIINDHIDPNDVNRNITVNVTFRSTLFNKQPLYFVAFYGDAKPFDKEIDVELLGVDMYNILGNATNCPEFIFSEKCKMKMNLSNVSILITNLQMNKLYGVTICAVIDLKNLTFPKIKGAVLGMKPKANKIYISSKAFQKYHPSLMTYIIAGSIATLFSLLCTFICIQRRQNAKIKLRQLKLEQMKHCNDLRYTNLPKKKDIWELERLNLIINDDQKLGSGAFGSVYKGRLIGLAKGNKNAQSTLGVNLMRAGNCDVAVKKLPEYADQLSKSEFLREISLMKTLGYHERLVNMLACITETEPYCLVVEYCSDGDLLHFLRKRCAYMMKLTEMGIDYDEPNLSDKINTDLVITLKQLLMFAVQISYGLEYLSQKGFVHRDVAARNVLVHEGKNAKIGDFGLCRYIYRDIANYKSKGGRLPVKWMSPEAIRYYEFTTQSDVWSFGILMFEIVTLGGTPYPGIQPDDMLGYLDAGERLDQPDNCPDNYYEVMRSCWAQDPSLRPNFGDIRQKLASQLEDITDQYSYLKLDNQRDYYNVTYDVGVLSNDFKEQLGDDQQMEMLATNNMKSGDISDKVKWSSDMKGENTSSNLKSLSNQE